MGPLLRIQATPIELKPLRFPQVMTGFLGFGENPLSAVSIAAFEDSGYDVDYSQADPYTLPTR